MAMMLATAIPGAAFAQAGDDADPRDSEGLLHPTCEVPVEPLAEYEPAWKGSGEYDSVLAAALDRIERDSLYEIVADLQGFGTRYEFSAQQESAAVYLFERLEAMGYRPAYHRYEISTWDVNDLSFADSLNGWFVASSGYRASDSSVVARTDDGGATWRTEATAPKKLNGVKAISTDDVWAVGSAGLIYHYDGNEWTERPPLGDQHLVAVDFIDGNRGMVATYGKPPRVPFVYTTGDGGATWHADSLTGILYDLRYVAGNAAWVCGSSGRIWRYSGNGWSEQSTPTNKSVYQIDFSDTTFGCAAISANAVLVWDGNAWSSVASELERDAWATAALGDSAIYLAGRDSLLVGHVYHSADRGETWEEVALPTGILFTTPYAIHTGNGGRSVMLAGTGGMMLRSLDGGGTWSVPEKPAEIVHPSRNVYADHYGEVHPSRTVILSGHYDSIVHSGGDPMVTAPGADDDASGVAAVLEAARVLADVPTDRTVRFLLFSGEELGLLGSTAYAIDAREAGDDIVADVQIDMISFPNGDPLRFITNEESTWILDEAAPLRGPYAPGLNLSLLISPNETFSDHASFWANGYAGIQVSETIDYQTNALHTVGDTLGHLDFDFALESARLTTALTATLAGIAARDTIVPPAGPTLPFPNPGSSRFTIPVSAPAGGEIGVTVYNAAGRRVWQNRVEASSSPTTYVEWDGHDSDGDQARTGVYFARIETPAGETTRKLILVR